jgi:hypothetical protein
MRTALLLLFFAASAHAQQAAPRAVPTFESLGLYWSPPAAPAEGTCPARYRKHGESEWKDALPLWYDARNKECRGSIVHLTPGTQYEVAIASEKPVTARTWSESFPVGKNVEVGNRKSLEIREGGSEKGYVVYTAGSIDSENDEKWNITIAAPYVIVRGLTLKGAKIDAIRLLPGAHDVVIEDNDISDWGRLRIVNSRGWQLGVDMDSGIRAVCKPNEEKTVSRVIIQKNRIHHPRYTANSWSFGHPSGPQAITFSYCGGNHVIRWNEIYSEAGHYFNDAIGGEDNFSATGFPNADSDIYGNRISHAWDDGIESEGGNRNVRIWGNYLDLTGTGVATTVTHVGPVYIFRNVYNRSRMMSERLPDADDRGPFAKSGTTQEWGGGRRYIFHNTLLQPKGQFEFPLGAGAGIAGNSKQPLTNTVSRNNLWNIWKPRWAAIEEAGGSGNDFDYDAYNGVVPRRSEKHGIEDDVSKRGTVDRGVRIPNFNDAFAGRAPDIGAHEEGAPAQKFGLEAAGVSDRVAGVPSRNASTSPVAGRSAPRGLRADD